jgi:hypothetical protein
MTSPKMFSFCSLDPVDMLHGKRILAKDLEMGRLSRGGPTAMTKVLMRGRSL